MTLLQAGNVLTNIGGNYPEIPKIIEEQAAIIQVILWLGGVMVTFLFGALVFIWRDRDKHITYIRQSDKENILVIKALTDNQSILVVDVSKMKDLLAQIDPKVISNNEILGKLHDNINDIKNKI